LDLWERAPGSARSNLLSVGGWQRAPEDDTEAKRYYNDAIYRRLGRRHRHKSRRAGGKRGWNYPLPDRRNEMADAQSVLMATAAALQPDSGAPLHTQVGNLMLEGGEAQQGARRNLKRRCESILTIARQPRARDWPPSRWVTIARRVRYSKKLRASSANRNSGQENADPRIAQDLAIAEMTPRARSLRRASRYSGKCPPRREIFPGCLSLASRNAPRHRTSRLNHKPRKPRNAPPTISRMLYGRAAKLRNSVGEDDLLRHPQSIDPVMEMVFDMETKVTARCGPPVHPADAALARIAQTRRKHSLMSGTSTP